MTPSMAQPGVSSLGLGLGANPADTETEDEKRKRLIAAQQSRLLPNAGASSLMGAIGDGYGTAIG